MGSSRWLFALAVAFFVRVAFAHDVSVEAGAAVTSPSADNPRVGNASVAVAGTFEATDEWAVFATAQYTRDLATSTAEFTATGSNVLLLGLGASWAPSENLVTMLDVTGSPPTTQLNATTVTVNGRSADVVVNAQTWSLGGLWTGAWMSAGESNLESMVDVALGLTRFDVFQRMQLGSSGRAQLLRAACNTALYQKTPLCRLLTGASTPLLQGRLGGGYTATLFGSTDVSLSATYYLYDKDPDEVGFFSLVALGRAELGNGVPVLPLQVSLKPSVAHRFGPLTLRVAYQLGLYQNGNGSNHVFSGKLTWKTSRSLRLYLSLTGQFDTTQGEVVNPGGNGVLGALVSW